MAVFVHGGAWKSSWSLDLADAMADDLAHRGWATWNMEYARCGHIDNDMVMAVGHQSRCQGRCPQLSVTFMLWTDVAKKCDEF